MLTLCWLEASCAVLEPCCSGLLHIYFEFGLEPSSVILCGLNLRGLTWNVGIVQMSLELLK